MNEWQPIETAPKDGTSFDGWGTLINDDAVIHHPEPIRHTKCYWGGRDSDSVRRSRKFGKEGWCTEGHDGWSWGIVLTHWMPEPDEPCSVKQDK